MERTDMPGLLGMLQERGYEWQDEPYADVFYLTASAGSVRVVSYRDSEPSLRVVAMDSREAHRWSVRVEPDVPFNVVVALIGAAEDELRAIAFQRMAAKTAAEQAARATS